MTAGTNAAIEIVLNGEARSVVPPTNLLALLKDLGIDPEQVAVELNRRIVRRPEWATTAVGDKAEIEVVQFVGGG